MEVPLLLLLLEEAVLVESSALFCFSSRVRTRREGCWGVGEGRVWVWGVSSSPDDASLVTLPCPPPPPRCFLHRTPLFPPVSVLLCPLEV